jgi:hypothetical protein
MSAPHVAGAAALLRQAHPDWTVEDIKAALMNTAIYPLQDLAGAPYPESRIGAGRLSVADALDTDITVRALTLEGDVSLSFGTFEVASSLRQQRRLLVRNHGNEAVTLNVHSTMTQDHPGVKLRPLVNSVTVPPHDDVFVDVRLEVVATGIRWNPDETTLPELNGIPHRQMTEASGQIWFSDASRKIHVPWYVVVRSVGKYAAGWGRAGVPEGERVGMPIPTRGNGGPTPPLVGLFELGIIHPSLSMGGMRAATDVVALGVATDYGSVGSVAASRLHFAVVMDGKWLTPQRAFHEFEIQIDRSFNGVADFVLANADWMSLLDGNLNSAEGASDAWVVARRSGAGGLWQEVGPWHPLDADAYDLVPFQTGALVYSVLSADLGLTQVNSRFRYRAVTRGMFADTTPWIAFDPAKWSIDPTRDGLDQTPFWVEGPTPKIEIHRAHALENPLVAANETLSLLLVHWHNSPGQQHEVVQLDLSTSDADGDGLPDAWELEWLGDLASDGQGDRDGDGFSDWDEYIAGTDPLDSESRLQLFPPTHPGQPISWTSVSDRTYSILRSNSLDGSYVTIRTGILATPSLNEYRDPLLDQVLKTNEPGPVDGPWFYRVQVEWPGR